MRQTCILGFLCLMHCASLVVAAEKIPFDSSRWTVEADSSLTEQYRGKTALLIKGGLAIVEDSDFINGVIEFDIAFPPGRNFVGVVFRFQDDANYEHLYFRPHMSGLPDAVQYTPVYNGVSGWQLYHGEGFGAAIPYDHHEWMHVRFVIADKQAELYINYSEAPTMFMHDIKREVASGKVGLLVPGFGYARFANFEVTELQNPELKSAPREIKRAEKGAIMSWQISGTLKQKQIETRNVLEQSFKETLTWDLLTCEPSGIANLARLRTRDRGNEKNTVFARLVMTAEQDQIKKMSLGFSDIVKVYVNDRAIFGGNDTYSTRDYRYLGTVGFFDDIYLPLKSGENEVLIAITENFGGWGLQARFDDLSDISIDESRLTLRTENK